MRLIDADALKEKIEQYQIQWNRNCESDIAHWDSCETILSIINNAPTVEQTIITEFKGCDNCELERPTGEWIVGSEYDCFSHIEKTYTCPFCNHRYYTKYPFCTCGAKMQNGGATDEP